jgi:hypothetical protein
MVALNRLTSVLIKEETVNITLQGQKDYIDQNIAKMVNNTVPMTGQQAEHLFKEICNMAVCQWKIQGESLRNMPSNSDPSTINPTYYYHRQQQWYYNHNNHDPYNKGRTSTPEMSREHNGQGHVSMVEDMKVLTKQQIKSSEMMMSTVEAMRVLIEQQKKTSEIMMEMVRQMTATTHINLRKLNRGFRKVMGKINVGRNE